MYLSVMKQSLKAFDTKSGLIVAYRINKKGLADPIGWENIATTPRDTTFSWVHLDCTRAPARQWLKKESGLSREEFNTVLNVF